MTDETKRMILCVDDEQDVVDALYDTFMDQYDVITATSAKEALTLFEKHDIALVISDQRMPQMEGTELLAKINAEKPICKKILLTGYADINAAVDAINLGSVDRYLSKPWDDEELLKAVVDLLALHKIDQFLENMLEDGKNLKARAEYGRQAAASYEAFLDSYGLGVCVVDAADNIQYLNKRGLEIVRYWDAADAKGKDFKSIFMMDGIDRKQCHEKYLKKDLSPDTLTVKRGDGSEARVAANLTFAVDTDGVRICGIVFDESKD